MNNLFRIIFSVTLLMPILVFAKSETITQLGDSVMVHSVFSDNQNLSCHRYYLMQGDRIRLVSEDGVFPYVPIGMYKVIEDACDSSSSSILGTKKSYRHKNIFIRKQSIKPSNIPDYMLVDMGGIRGGTIRFESQSGRLLQDEKQIGKNGITSFSKSEIIAGMGSDEYMIVSMNGGIDYDIDNDGILESTGMAVQGETQIILPKEYMKQPWSIIYNIRSIVTSDMLMTIHKSYSIDGLYQIIKESGVDDLNKDGLMNYEDILYTRMQDAKGLSTLIPFLGYKQSIISGDLPGRELALKRIFSTENHIMKTIIANPENEYDHLPALRLESLSSSGLILYTLDGSVPMKDATGTLLSTGTLAVLFQDKTIYFREMVASGTGYIFGSVGSFDLVSDWTTLAQEATPYDYHGKKTHTESIYQYKNQSYVVIRESNIVGPAYTFPKSITCMTLPKKDAGCDYGPYLMWSDSHEERVEKLVKMGMEDYINKNIK